MAELTNFFDLSITELESIIINLEQPPYRARQVWHWAYRTLVHSFIEMSNVPISLREHLAENFTLIPANTASTMEDWQAQTRKDVLRFQDGETIETVSMVEPHGHTVCVSTQAGCPLKCSFCATGQSGYRRNLTAGEIVYQVVHAAKLLKQSSPTAAITNVVFMGMGEPFLNYEATLAAAGRMADEKGLAIVPRRITVSTVGIPEGIRRLAQEELPVRLAISLHATEDTTRRNIMPVAGRIPLSDILAACRYYVHLKRERISFEYVLISGINDSGEDARRLVSLIGSLPAHVNLIPLNPTKGSSLRPSEEDVISDFRSVLSKARIPVTVRYSRGVSIRAGCGQLRGGDS